MARILKKAADDVSLPKSLPLANINDIMVLKASRVVSLVLQVHESRKAIDQTIGRTNAHTLVANVPTNDADKNLEFSTPGARTRQRYHNR